MIVKKSILTYDSVEWSEEDKTHIAKCLEFPSLMAHGDTIEGALKEIKEVVQNTVEWMDAENERIPEPFGMKRFKGNLTLRVPIGLCHGFYICKNTCQSATPTAQLRIAANVV